MDRRSFMVASAAAAALGASPMGCADAASVQGAAPPPAPPGPPHPELEEATIADLAARMQRGELTAADLCRGYLARIEALDRHGPAIRAVIEVNPDAVAIAEGLDAERRAGRVRGPLHGIPLLVKDNLDTGDRMETTAGSLALAGTRAHADAHVVRRLREAGAVLLGKTNLSEWANIRASKSTSGWSGRGGLTRNPYALDRNTSGSSSGSAAAVTASLCAAAIGTETDGSIVSPSSICGIVGMKPTVGLWSRAGIIPISRTQDTAGPMARTVADVALLLAAVAGPDPRDVATSAQPARPADAYLKALDPRYDGAASGPKPRSPAEPNGAKGLRVGVVRAFPDIAKPVMTLFDAAVEDLRRLGAVVIDPVDLGPMAKIGDPELLVLLHELKAGMAEYLATRGPEVAARAIEDVVKWNGAHSAEELRWFGQDLFEQSAAKGPLDAPAYTEALAACKRYARDEGIDAAMKTHQLDVLVAPTGGPAWITDLVNGDAFTGSSSTPAAVAGYPSITVPAGALHGLPIGISFFAGAWSEPTLLRIAYAYEQATKRRIRPRMLATIDEGNG